MNEIIDRATAKARGLPQYFTGRPCPHGHIGPRYTGSASCVECTLRLSRAKYDRNRDEILARDRQRRIEKADELRAQKRAQYAANKEAIRAAVKARYNTPEGRRRSRENSLRRLYGVTSAEYDEVLRMQGGGCGICGAEDPGKGHAHFAVDHDHVSGRPRGLLCHRCNRAFGLFGDSMPRLLAAAAYLNGVQGPPLKGSTKGE